MQSHKITYCCFWSYLAAVAAYGGGGGCGRWQAALHNKKGRPVHWCIHAGKATSRAAFKLTLILNIIRLLSIPPVSFYSSGRGLPRSVHILLAACLFASCSEAGIDAAYYTFIGNGCLFVVCGCGVWETIIYNQD